MGAQIIALTHVLRAIPPVLISPGMSSPHSSHAGWNLVFPGSWHQGRPCWWLGCWSVCQLAVNPSQHRVCGFCLYSFLTPHAQPFQANREPSAHDELGFSSCSVTSNEYSGSFPFWLFCLLLSCIIIFELVQTCIPHFFLSPFVWVCGASSIHTTGQVNLQPTASWRGFGQPTQCSDSSHDITGKLTLWQHPKGPSFLMG